MKCLSRTASAGVVLTQADRYAVAPDRTAIGLGCERNGVLRHLCSAVLLSLKTRRGRRRPSSRRAWVFDFRVRQCPSEFGKPLVARFRTGYQKLLQTRQLLQV